jgi:hypothetical protein
MALTRDVVPCASHNLGAGPEASIAPNDLHCCGLVSPMCVGADTSYRDQEIGSNVQGLTFAH